MISKCHHIAAALCISVLVGGLMGGCSDKDGSKSKTRSQEGIAKIIDIENRTVSMTWIDKKGESKEIVGTFTDQTEVEINGRRQGIADIRPNDKVKVFGKKETIGGVDKLVATKVIVTRPKGSDWVSTTKPAGAAPKEPKPAGN